MFIDSNLVKNVINGVNLVKMGHFILKWPKLANSWCKNDVICQIFLERGQKYLSKN